MESEGSLPCSQEVATGLCPEPDESSPQPHNSIALKVKVKLSLFISKNHAT
jgi:hypothetical protein